MKPNPINANQLSLKDLVNQIEGQMLPGYRAITVAMAPNDVKEFLIDGTDIIFPRLSKDIVPTTTIEVALNQGDKSADWFQLTLQNHTFEIHNFPFYRVVLRNVSAVLSHNVTFWAFTNPFYLIQLHDYLDRIRV